MGFEENFVGSYHFNYIYLHNYTSDIDGDSFTPCQMAYVCHTINGSAVITPVITIVDLAVVNSVCSGDMRGSLISAGKQFALDEKAVLTLACTFSTLFATNWFVDENLSTAAGTVVNTVLSMAKDSVFMGGSLTKTTRVLFVAKDIISILPSVSFPGLCFLDRLILVFLTQIPCTLLNSLAMDIHIFRDSRRRSTRIQRSFFSNFPIRFFKSAVGNALAGHINYGIITAITEP